MKIKHLKLDCASIHEQKHFYTKKFKFKILEEDKNEFTIQVGDSLLSFRENRLRKPYYHFAFNIPYASVKKALEWVKKRVPVIATDDGEIQDFAAWQAKAFYFLDPAGNIVEFIGRERFHSSEHGAFNEKKVLNISEIGLPVFEVSSAFKGIHKATGIQKFDCTKPIFCTAGNDEGLFVIVDKAEKTWFPTDVPAKDYNLEVNFKEGEQTFYLSYYGEEIIIEKTGQSKA